MKGLLLLAISCLVLIAMSIGVLCTVHSIAAIGFSSTVLVTTLFVLLPLIAFTYAGSWHIYEFAHYYTGSNILSNTSRIVKKLPLWAIWKLKEYDKDLFKHDPVITNEHFLVCVTKREEYYKVTGWIKASSIDEAIRTLHYYDFKKTEPNAQYIAGSMSNPDKITIVSKLIK